MGRAKQWLFEQSSQGFYSRNTRVCARCVDDYALIKFIKKSGSISHHCSYCEESQRDKKTVAFDDFIRRFLIGVNTEWSDPNDEGVGWEHGWVGEVSDTYDLLTGELEIDFTTDELRQDIQSSLSDRQWCRRNFYELATHQAFTEGWKEFVKVVKHESRYVFFRREDSSADKRGREEIAPADFLDALSSIISDCRLHGCIPSGTAMIRLRTNGADEILDTAKQLGPPPPSVANFPNRMSAAGISAFYAAFDADTAIAETVSQADRPTNATLGHFKLLKDLYIVDFTKLPQIPSIFEINMNSRRHGIRFLRSFLSDFTAPVEKDGREHIDYVPTQIVAEYLRFIHRDEEQRSIDGILYRSSRQVGSNACVLFFGPEGVCDAGQIDDLSIVVLESSERIKLRKLKIDPS